MQKFIGIIVGIIFIIVGAFLFLKNNNLVKNCTEEIEATVVDMKQDFSTDDGDASYIYYPIIEYKANENNVRVTMDSGSNTPAYNIGDKITILYNPNKVKEFIVKGNKSSNIISIIFMVIGVFVTGYGVITALKKH